MPEEKSSFARFAGNTSFSAGRSMPSRVTNGGSTPASPSDTPESLSGESRPGTVTAFLFDAIISVSLVALCFGLPIFFTGMTFQGIAFEKQIYFYFWLLVGLIAWVSKGVVMSEMKIRRTPLDIPILLFWAFYVVAAFFSVDRWHSFWGFFGDPSRGVISITALVLLYYFLLSHFSAKRFYWMLGSFLLSGTIVALWSTLVVMKVRFLPAAVEKFAPMSLIGTVSTLGVFLGLLVPLFLTAIFALWKQDSAFSKLKRNVWTGLALVGLTLSLFLLLTLYAYVPWIVLLSGLSFFMIYLLAQIVRPAEQWTWLPMLVFVVVLAFLMIGKNQLSRATLPVEVAPNTKLSWQIAKDAFADHFLTGVGPANYGYAFSMYRPVEYNFNTLYTLRFYQGTGLFFEAIPTIGAVGVILLLVLWFSFLSVGLYLLSHDKARNKIFSLGLWSASVMLFVAGFVAAINGAILLIGVLLSALSLAVLLWESASEERYLHLSLKAAPKFALALAFIFMVVSAGVAFLFVFMGKAMYADILAGKAIRMSAAAPRTDSVNLLARAAQSYPQEGRYYTRLGQEYMVLGNTEAAKNEADRSVDTVAFYVREAVAAGQLGRQKMPNDVMAVESLALLYENSALYASDALPKAEELYARAQELEPNNPLYSLKLGQVKKIVADGKPEGAERTQLYTEAKEFFEQSIEKKGNLGAPYYNLAVVLSRLKDIDAAIDRASDAVRYDRNNVNYQYNLGVLYQLRSAEGDENKAETIFKDVLSANERLIDVRFSLGLLYEKQGKRTEALEQYEKILSFLPEDAEGSLKLTREQIIQMIDNVKSGVGNITRRGTASSAAPVAPPVPDVPSTPVGPVPVEPNTSPLSGQGQ